MAIVGSGSGDSQEGNREERKWKSDRGGSKWVTVRVWRVRGRKGWVWERMCGTRKMFLCSALYCSPLMQYPTNPDFLRPNRSHPYIFSFFPPRWNLLQVIFLGCCLRMEHAMGTLFHTLSTCVWRWFNYATLFSKRIVLERSKKTVEIALDQGDPFNVKMYP